LWQEQQWWNAHDADTAALPRTGYALRPATVTAVQACLAHVTLATLPTSQLLGVARAALAAAEPARADSALTRLAMSVKETSARTRAWTLYQIVSVYMSAPEPRFAAAASYLSRLDALDTAAAAERMLAYQFVANRAHARDSVALEGAALAASVAASRQLTGKRLDRYRVSAARTYARWSLYFMRRGKVDSARAVLELGLHLVGAETMTEAPVLLQTLSSGVMSQVGKRAPPLVPNAWYTRDHDTAAAATNITRPRSGHPMFLVFDQSPHTYGNAKPGYAILHRLAAAYGPKGLDVVFVVRTTGLWQWRMVPPDSESLFLRKRWMEERALAGLLAISQTPLRPPVPFGGSVGNDPEPPGVIDRTYQPPPFEILDPHSPLVGYVIDANGIVRLITALSRVNEAMLQDVLRETLATMPAQPSSGSSASP